MDGFQHRAVTAEGHDNLGRVQWAITIAEGQLLKRFFGNRGRRGLERDPAGGIGDQSRLRCSSTGISRRTRAVTFGSRRAVAHPVPSDTFATV